MKELLFFMVFIIFLKTCQLEETNKKVEMIYDNTNHLLKKDTRTLINDSNLIIKYRRERHIYNNFFFNEEGTIVSYAQRGDTLVSMPIKNILPREKISFNFIPRDDDTINIYVYLQLGANESQGGYYQNGWGEKVSMDSIVFKGGRGKKFSGCEYTIPQKLNGATCARFLLIAKDHDVTNKKILDQFQYIIDRL